MPSLFCCLREWAADAVRPAFPVHRCIERCCPAWGREGRGWREALPGTVRSSFPAAVPRYFRLWDGQEPCPGWIGSFRTPAARGSVAVASPVPGRAFCFVPSRPPEGICPPFLYSAGDMGKGIRKQKGPPARSRWPWISRRRAAAYSPATAFWCSAMTLSATGWGASS